MLASNLLRSQRWRLISDPPAFASWVLRSRMGMCQHAQFYAELESKPRILCMLGKHSTIELHPNPEATHLKKSQYSKSICFICFYKNVKSSLGNARAQGPVWAFSRESLWHLANNLALASKLSLELFIFSGPHPWSFGWQGPPLQPVSSSRAHRTAHQCPTQTKTNIFLQMTKPLQAPSFRLSIPGTWILEKASSVLIQMLPAESSWKAK